MTYREHWEWGRFVLEEAHIAEAKLEARLLLEHVCHMDRSRLIVHAEETPLDTEGFAYRELVRKRAEHIPLQQLLGVQNFMGLDFKVNEHVLVPRQDTEVLVEEAIRDLEKGMRILDLCTGSGCILLSLLSFVHGCQGVGVDLSKEALAVAVENADRLLGAQAESVEFLHSDLFEEVDGKFDMIVSNPPYIASAVIPALMPEVRDHEPLMALDGGEDGLSFYRRIVKDSGKYLKPGGGLYLEIGYDQREAVLDIMKTAGFTELKAVKDLAGLDRVVHGRYPGGAM